MKRTEKSIEKEILDYLNIIGWATKLQAGIAFIEKRAVRMGTKGSPDILACVSGRFIAIEVKKDQNEVKRWLKKSNDPKNKREFAQKQQLTKIDACGGLSMIVSSLDEVSLFLKENIESKY